jgi:antirestriction protein ArdC
MTTVITTPVAPSFNLAEELWASMQAGLAPWQKTWKGGEAPGRPENVTTGNEYRSGNSLYLMMAGLKNGWSGKWVSFKESMKLGGDLKGQRGTKIEVPLIKKGIDKATGLEKDILRGFRTCTVFNVDQVTGVDFVGKTPTTFIESVAAADKMLAALQAQGLTYVEPTEDGGCWYLPAEDKIGMPRREAFKDSYEFYSALIHEMSHATMKEGRVERERISFAYEEMRAEIAATLVCCTLNLPRSQEQVDNHAAFLKAWLEEFVDQKSMLLKAASEAQLIHDYLMDLSTAV